MEEIIDRLKKVRRGAMFIIEAPSGTGKSAVVKEILRRDPNIKFSVSVTTRQPREGEVDGVDYYFITDKQYDEFLAQDAFTNMSIPNTVPVTERCALKLTVSSTSVKTCCSTWTGPARAK